jgi:acetyl esterase/lipase
MNRRMAAVLVVVLGALAGTVPAGPVHSAPVVRAVEPPLVPCTLFVGLRVCTDIPYGRHSAALVGSTQRLDIFKPDGPGPFPVIVWLHGGGWTGGNRREGYPVHDDWNGLNRQVSRGYAVVSVDYRLAGGDIRYQQQVRDVKQAIRWVKWQGERYGLSPTAIAVGGHSAGGHLATMAAATDGLADFEPTDFGTGYEPLAGYTSTTRLAIGYAGVYDLRQPLPEAFGIPDSASQLLGCDLPEGTDIPDLSPCTHDEPRLASPINYLRGAPVFLAHGDDDPLARPAQARTFNDARVAATQPTVLRWIPLGGHGGVVPTWPDNANPYLDVVLEYYVRGR